MIYKIHGNAIRRSKALAHTIDGMARNHHRDAAGYFGTAESPHDSEARTFARQVIRDDCGVTFEEDSAA